MDVIPLGLPPIDRAQLTSMWLKTSMDEIQVDYYDYEPDESVTTVDTDLSCSESESEPEPAVSSQKSDAEVPITPPSEQIQRTSVRNYSVDSSNPAAPVGNSESASGFFVNFKRRLSSITSIFKPSKKPRLDSDIK